MLQIAKKARLASLISGLIVVGAGGSWIADATTDKGVPGTVHNRTPVSVSKPPLGSDHSVEISKSSDESLVKASLPKSPVTIRKPAGPPRVNLGILDAAGEPVTAACSTCHTTRPANSDNRLPADLDEFHQSMAFAHGKVSCLSCHNPNDYDTLRLADGTVVEYVDVMKLCAQCHGPQTRDYEHGAHGGMNGYWDLSRGPRTRNNCIDCHHPHFPSFPAMKPTFKPRDRFLNSDDITKGSSHE